MIVWIAIGLVIITLLLSRNLKGLKRIFLIDVAVGTLAILIWLGVR